MTTRDEVIDAINRIERAGHAGEVTRAAQIDLLLSPPPQYGRILDRLRAAFPGVFRLPSGPPEPAEQRATAAQAMRDAEVALSQQQSTAAEFDRQVVEALRCAQKTTVDGRRSLFDLQAQIETAARSWDLSTPAGAREFQRFLITKLGQIAEVVQEANADDTSKQALAAALATLYAAQPGPGSAAGAVVAPDADPWPVPENLSVTDVGHYLDGAADDDPQPVEASPPARGIAGAPPAAAPPAVPAVPAFGGEVPGGGAPAGYPPGGWAPYPRYTEPAEDPDREPVGSAGVTPPGDAPYSELSEADAGSGTPDGPEAEADAGPATVTLPDGETITVATPQLAAVLQAAADGTPIADAFRQQGITIPPPGTAVTGPLDPSRVDAGDIGVFTDRHALAVDGARALLDGQIQRIGNVRGPSFLGWQHSPLPGQTAAAPAPTRPSAAVRV